MRRRGGEEAGRERGREEERKIGGDRENERKSANERRGVTNVARYLVAGHSLRARGRAVKID